MREGNNSNNCLQPASKHKKEQKMRAHNDIKTREYSAIISTKFISYPFASVGRRRIKLGLDGN